MLTSVPEALIEKTNIVKSSWNLYIQPLKNIKSIVFYASVDINLFPVFGTGYTLVNNMTKINKWMLLIKWISIQNIN
jgi:hypothetical protein